MKNCDENGKYFLNEFLSCFNVVEININSLTINNFYQWRKRF